MTVTEFKYWLNGVEEMLSVDPAEGWHPDKRQWDKIREKIDQLTETPTTSHFPVQQFRSYNDAPRAPIEDPVPVDPNRSVQYANAGIGLAAVPAPAVTSGTVFGNSDVPGSLSRTPNIDSSNGQYQPAFL